MLNTRRLALRMRRNPTNSLILGKPISYVNWYSVSQAYSSIYHDMQDCVTLVPFHGGKWEVENCYTGNDVTEPKHLFICEFGKSLFCAPRLFFYPVNSGFT